MYSSIPNCMTNTCPTANFRIHLDMQMEILANEPVYAGLYGVQLYRSPYADPDMLRCSAPLLRHYCIEGRKDRCFHDPYELKHLLNPDFEEGTAHWELQPAAPGSISTGKKGLQRLAGPLARPSALRPCVSGDEAEPGETQRLQPRRHPSRTGPALLAEDDHGRLSRPESRHVTVRLRTRFPSVWRCRAANRPARGVQLARFTAGK